MYRYHSAPRFIWEMSPPMPALLGPAQRDFSLLCHLKEIPLFPPTDFRSRIMHHTRRSLGVIVPADDMKDIMSHFTGLNFSQEMRLPLLPSIPPPFPPASRPNAALVSNFNSREFNAQRKGVSRGLMVDDLTSRSSAVTILHDVSFPAAHLFASFIWFPYELSFSG